MIKTTEKIDYDNEGFKEFQQLVSVMCKEICDKFKETMTNSIKSIGAEILNLEDIEKELNGIINAKLLVKIPDRFVYYENAVNAESEAKPEVTLDISELGFRLCRILITQGIRSDEDLKKTTMEELMKMHGFGIRSRRRLTDYMIDRKLKFKEK